MDNNNVLHPADHDAFFIQLCNVILVSLFVFLVLMLPKRRALLLRRVLVCVLLGGAVPWETDFTRSQTIICGSNIINVFTDRLFSTDGSLAVEAMSQIFRILIIILGRRTWLNCTSPIIARSAWLYSLYAKASAASRL